MKRVGEMMEQGQTVVFAVGADASIEAVAARVNEVTGGAMETFVLSEAATALVEEVARGDPTGMEQREVYGIRSAYPPRRARRALSDRFRPSGRRRTTRGSRSTRWR